MQQVTESKVTVDKITVNYQQSIIYVLGARLIRAPYHPYEKQGTGKGLLVV